MLCHSPALLVSRSLRILTVLACLTCASIAQDVGNCTAHDPSTRPDCPGAIAFFKKLQTAVNAGQKTQLASMVSYPMHAMQNGKRIQVRTRQQFLSQYPKLFTPAVVCAVKTAKDSDVWGNYQGFMIGSGVIWWDAVIPASVKNPQSDSGKYPFKIISINNENVMAPGCTSEKQP
jgi:hypothetical protein